MKSRTHERIFVDGFLAKTNEGLSSVCKLYLSKTQTACVDTVAIGQSLRKARTCKPHTGDHRNHGENQEFIYHGTTEAKNNFSKISAK